MNEPNIKVCFVCQEQLHTVVSCCGNKLSKNKIAANDVAYMNIKNYLQHELNTSLPLDVTEIKIYQDDDVIDIESFKVLK